MLSAQQLHQEHTQLISNLSFIKDEIHFIKDVIYDRSSKSENNFQKERYDNIFEDVTQLADSLSELEINSNALEAKIKVLLENGTIKMEDPIFQSSKGISELLAQKERQLKEVKKQLFNLK